MLIASIITALAGLGTAVAAIIRASRGHAKNAARIDELEKKGK